MIFLYEWSTIVHEYELRCAEPERNLFYWPIHSVEVAGAFQYCFVLILVHIAFDDLQSTSAEDTHNTPHHDLDGTFQSLLAC